MIDLSTARELVKDYLHIGETRANSFGSALPGYEKRPKHELVIVREQEYEFGWLFCWGSKEFADSGDAKHALIGAAPLIVDRSDGQIYATGTAHQMEYYIDEYRRGIRHPAKHAAYQWRCSLQPPPFQF